MDCQTVVAETSDFAHIAGISARLLMMPEEPFWTGSRTPGCRAGCATDVELVVHSGLVGKYFSRARDTVLLVGRRRSDRMSE